MYWTTGLYSITINGIPTFQAADPAGGVPSGTELTYPWFRDVQGELLNVAQATGIAPAPNTPTQVMQGIKRVAGGNITVVAASGALTADNAGTVLVNAAGGNVALTLPAAASAGGIPLSFNIIRIDTVVANTVTVTAAGSDTFMPGGVTTGNIAVGRDCEVVGDGVSVWWTPFRGRLIGTQRFLSSGSYSRSLGATKICVRYGIGGGGSGAGSLATSSSVCSTCSGGASGSWLANYWFDVTGTSTASVVIGSGGGAATGAGNTGGTTSMTGTGWSFSIPGGGGGAVLQNAITVAYDMAAQGDGGALPTITGALNAGYASSGAPGPCGVLFSGSVFSGQGASSPSGGGGLNTNGGNGTNGTGYGSGGGGGAAQASSGTVTGGAGAPGFIIIEEYS